MKPLILLLTACLIVESAAFAADSDYLTYEQFVAAVEAGSVKRVELDRFGNVNGTHTGSGAERPFHTFGETGSANDVLLVRLLQAQKVNIAIQKDRLDDPWLNLTAMLSFWLMAGAPFVSLILLIFVNRKLNRLGKRIAQLGENPLPSAAVQG